MVGEGATVSVSDTATACPASISANTFTSSYSCWWGNPTTTTTITATDITIGSGITAVHPTSSSVTITKAKYFFTSGTTDKKSHLTPEHISGSFTLPDNAPLGAGEPVTITESVNPSSFLHTRMGVGYLTSTVAGSSALSIANGPIVNSFTPTAGPTGGHTTVTLTGTSFSTATAVKFGTTTALHYSVTGPTTITATSPPHPAGPVTITVTTPAGSNASSGHYTYDPVPTLTVVTPSAGKDSGGTMVALTGSGFRTGATTVTFGAGNHGATVHVTGTTTLTVKTPSHSTGTVTVAVTTPGGTSGSQHYSYDPIPTLTVVTPSAGKLVGGTVVTLTGTGFRTGATVTFGAGNHGTTVHVSGTTSLTVKTPAHAAGTVTVTVSTIGGTSGTKAYAYDPVPTITSLSRTSGPASGGTQVTITGTGFLSVQNVKFGTSTAQSFTVKSATKLLATSPAHAAGTVRISVTTPGGTTPATPADVYKFTLSVPVVSAISPASGPAAGGTTVTVSGSGLAGATKVYFGTATGRTISVNAGGTQLTVKSPAGTSGTAVNVRVVTPGGESAAAPAHLFTYGPTITSLSRTSGPPAGGTKVTIAGSGFSTVTSVKFGTTTAKSYTVSSPTSIIATSPAHAAGQVRISVTTTAGTTPATGNDLYTYT